MKVFLGNAPWVKEGYYGVRAGSRWPHLEKETHNYIPFPFFLGYAAGLLEKNGFNVLLVDAVAERIGKQQFFDRIRLFSPDIMLLEVSTISIDIDLLLAKELQQFLPPHTKIIFAGMHYGMYNERFLKEYQFVDFVLKGEYEYTLLELVQCLEQKIDLSSVSGVIYRDKAGIIHNNPDRRTIQDLNILPWPARHFLPKERYEDLPDILPKPTAQMWSSRGCPYKCIFCAWPQIMYRENRYRIRDTKNVVDEMEYLVSNQGYKSIYFDDDVFGIGKERVLKICNEIKKRKLNIPWAVMSRADVFDEDVLRVLFSSGLRAVKYGVESASQEIIDNAGKNLDLGKVSDIVKITKQLGIYVHLTFMLGLPGEVKETMKKTVDFALQLDPDSVQFSIATPFLGSRYYEMLKKKGYILSKTWSDYDGYSRAVIRTDSLFPEELEEALKEANQIWQEHIVLRNMKKERMV